MRDRQTIQQEYGQICAQIGERSFQISIMEDEIDALRGRILELGKEIKALDDKEKAAKASNLATAQPIADVAVSSTGGQNEVAIAQQS